MLAAQGTATEPEGRLQRGPRRRAKPARTRCSASAAWSASSAPRRSPAPSLLPHRDSLSQQARCLYEPAATCHSCSLLSSIVLGAAQHTHRHVETEVAAGGERAEDTIEDEDMEADERGTLSRLGSSEQLEFTISYSQHYARPKSQNNTPVAVTVCCCRSTATDIMQKHRAREQE